MLLLLAFGLAGVGWFFSIIALHAFLFFCILVSLFVVLNLCALLLHCKPMVNCACLLIAHFFSFTIAIQQRQSSIPSRAAATHVLISMVSFVVVRLGDWMEREETGGWEFARAKESFSSPPRSEAGRGAAQCGRSRPEASLMQPVLRSSRL